tara:strand:- start:9965 stop:10162 length:198 start_codon:yes stop_codon:yes gene_type:complete
MEISNYYNEDDFLYQIDLSIETGNINYIRNAIRQYKDVLSIYYIDWANRIIMELTQDSMNEMIIN